MIQYLLQTQSHRWHGLNLSRFFFLIKLNDIHRRKLSSRSKILYIYTLEGGDVSPLDKLLAYSYTLVGLTCGLHQFICLSHHTVLYVGDWSSQIFQILCQSTKTGRSVAWQMFVHVYIHQEMPHYWLSDMFVIIKSLCTFLSDFSNSQALYLCICTCTTCIHSPLQVKVLHSISYCTKSKDLLSEQCTSNVGTHRWSRSLWISKWTRNRSQCPRIPHSSPLRAKFSFELLLSLLLVTFFCFFC